VNEPLLVVNDLTKTFANGVRAVDGVSLMVRRGETLGLVGESGCGKSTAAKMILRLLTADSGEIVFDGGDVRSARGARLKELRKRLQVVPQNPQTSLNPRLSVRSSVEFNLRAHGVARSERARRVDDLLDRVGLARVHAGRFPHELSGGQLQRVAIARALASGPSLVVCDEAVSALDKSIQAQVLNLLVELQRDLGVAYLFISHDLAVVEHISDRVSVMYLGRVVEESDSRALWRTPLHPFTEALLSATPGKSRDRIVLRGELPSPTAPPSGCHFRTRCPVAIEQCAEARPMLIAASPDHLVACVHHSTPYPAAESLAGSGPRGAGVVPGSALTNQRPSP
jgi:peptide/nickel transport system ATP-binding protein/oligopeptide transport system ATP-binding protein